MSGSNADGWKGFSWQQLRRFGVRRGRWSGRNVIYVPYRTPDGKMYREKVFPLQPDRLRSWWSGPPKPQIPYGLETLQLGGNRCFLTEGESDAWALRAANPQVPVLCLPGADSWQDEWVAYLESFQKVYLCFDGDRPGRSMVDRVWADLGDKARYVRIPDGEDVRSVAQGAGVRAFADLVRDADRGYMVRMFFRSLERRGVVPGDADRLVSIVRFGQT